MPEDPVNCCPTGIVADSMVFEGDTIGPLSDIKMDLSLTFWELHPFVGINEITSPGSFSAYPNPAQKEVVIETRNPNDYKRISIVDLLGREVISSSVDDVLKLDVSSLKEGVYLIMLVSSGGGVSGTQKLLIER